MKSSSKLILAASGLILAAASAQAAFNYQVSGFQTQIAGTTTDVPGSGTSDNFDNTTVVGDFAVFDMVAVDDANGGATTNFANLKVTYFSDNGSAGSNVMIARTTNSQTLTDSGTISVLTNIGTNGGTISLKFEWYSFGSFIGGIEQGGASLLSTRINYTTFDIDFNQVVSVETDDIASYTLNATTELTATDDGTNISFEDSGSNSTFSDPDTAAQFLTIGGTAANTITMGKQSASGAALFMFEFRDPSKVVTFDDPEIVPIPEPSTAGIMIGAAALGLFLVKRRRKA